MEHAMPGLLAVYDRPLAVLRSRRDYFICVALFVLKLQVCEIGARRDVAYRYRIRRIY